MLLFLHHLEVEVGAEKIEKKLKLFTFNEEVYKSAQSDNAKTN